MDPAALLLPLSLLFVGAVLFLNGLWQLGKISDREITVINFVTASITGGVGLIIVITADDATDIAAAALTFLFTVTYLWVGINRLTLADGRGLGWFSFFVALTVLPKGIYVLINAQSVLDVWMGVNWLAWSGLWLMYFCSLALQRNIIRQTAFATLGAGIATAWAPALAIIYGITT
jgi:hypothetical protein